MWKCVWGVGKCAWGGKKCEKDVGLGLGKGEVGGLGRRMLSRPRTPTILTPPQTLPIPPTLPTKPHDPDPPTPISPTSNPPPDSPNPPTPTSNSPDPNPPDPNSLDLHFLAAMRIFAISKLRVECTLCRISGRN